MLIVTLTNIEKRPGDRPLKRSMKESLAWMGDREGQPKVRPALFQQAEVLD